VVNRSIFQIVRLALLLTVTGSLVGCGKDNKTSLTVDGTVRCDGDPLSGAIVVFEPLPGTSGPSATAPVFDGGFHVPADAGLHGGKYVARFSMIPPEIRGKLPPDQAANLPPKNAVIAPQHDARSRHTCELIADTHNQKTFEIEFLR
jgi:hypothetical protein